MEDSKIAFNSIDFEAATGLRTSACSVAIVRVENAEVVDRWSTFIKPPNNYYSQMCIDVHGMTPQCTINAPSFPDVYPEIKKRIDNTIMVAHNEQYDRSVFYACKEFYNLTDKLNLTEKWYCTKKIYKTLKFKPLKLNYLCEQFDIKLNHHDALSDAEACALLFINYLRNHTNE